MNDPTNWNVEPNSFEFKNPEEAKRAEEILNRMMRESFENGRNVGLEEAAKIFDKGWLEADGRWGQTADLEIIAADIRALRTQRTGDET